jgi:Fe-Mn family superoxide dismutase
MNTYSQPKLPYSSDALEPVISAETIGYHWGKHEKGYIDNLNRLIKGTEWEDTPLEDIIKNADGALFNNAAQAWNHIFYFFAFSPSGPRTPKGKLAKAIKRDFGSVDEFKVLFEKAGVELFGSGWVWLSYDKSGRLFITQGANADNPMIHGLVPLLCFDVWEHAYYIDYQNRRADSLHRLWEIINWDVVASRYIID